MRVRTSRKLITWAIIVGFVSFDVVFPYSAFGENVSSQKKSDLPAYSSKEFQRNQSFKQDQIDLMNEQLNAYHNQSIQPQSDSDNTDLDEETPSEDSSIQEEASDDTPIQTSGDPIDLVLDAFDANGDGAIDLEEAMNGYVILGRNIDGIDLQDLGLDFNEDGLVNADDNDIFLTYLSEVNSRAYHMTKAFSVVDDNGDWEISYDEGWSHYVKIVKMVIDLEPVDLIYDFTGNGRVTGTDIVRLVHMLYFKNQLAWYAGIVEANLSKNEGPILELSTAEGVRGFIELRRILAGLDPVNTRFDFNNDMAITEEDLEILMRVLPALNDEAYRMVRAFDVADQNNDWTIDYTEAISSWDALAAAIGSDREHPNYNPDLDLDMDGDVDVDDENVIRRLLQIALVSGVIDTDGNQFDITNEDGLNGFVLLRRMMDGPDENDVRFDFDRDGRLTLQDVEIMLSVFGDYNQWALWMTRAFELADEDHNLEISFEEGWKHFMIVDKIAYGVLPFDFRYDFSGNGYINARDRFVFRDMVRIKNELVYYAWRVEMMTQKTNEPRFKLSPSEAWDGFIKLGDMLAGRIPTNYYWDFNWDGVVDDKDIQILIAVFEKLSPKTAQLTRAFLVADENHDWSISFEEGWKHYRIVAKMAVFPEFEYDSTYDFTGNGTISGLDAQRYVLMLSKFNPEISPDTALAFYAVNIESAIKLDNSLLEITEDELDYGIKALKHMLVGLIPVNPNYDFNQDGAVTLADADVLFMLKDKLFGSSFSSVFGSSKGPIDGKRVASESHQYALQNTGSDSEAVDPDTSKLGALVVSYSPAEEYAQTSSDLTGGDHKLKIVYQRPNVTGYENDEPDFVNILKMHKLESLLTQ